MPKRLEAGAYIELARQRNFVFVGPYTGNTKDTIVWKCVVCSYEWKASYNRIHQGSECPRCIGHARITEDDYRSFEDRGISWAEETLPKTSSVKTLWECFECGHKWKTPYSGIRQGNGCPKCAGTMRITEEQYQELAKKKGFEWIGEFPENAHSRTNWRCARGHLWSATYSQIKHKSGCPKCSGHAIIVKEDYIALAKKKGVVFVGQVPSSTKLKTKWECSAGHRWDTSYSSLVLCGCPHCSGNAKKTKQDYIDLAERSGFVFVGPFPRNTGTPTLWECSHGHRWNTRYSDINMGRNCPRCCGHAKITASDYVELARWRGFTWLGEYPKSTSKKTEWQCSRGHQWEAAYQNIKSGTGCPRCVNMINGVKASQAQIQIADALSAEVNYKVGRRYVDCAIIESRVAIEYDCWFWHGHKSEEDYDRAQEIISCGWSVLCVKANRLLPTSELLAESIRQLSEHPYIELILDDWGSGKTREQCL